MQIIGLVALLLGTVAFNAEATASVFSVFEKRNLDWTPIGNIRTKRLA
jgi:hypothetical protein